MLDAADYEAAAALEYEPEDEVEYEPEDQVDYESEAEVEVEAAPERRREPLRARPAAPRRVRIRFTDGSDAVENTNGPIFRSDLRSAADLDRVGTGDEQSPVPPLTAPPSPVEPVRRRRRQLRAR